MNQLTRSWVLAKPFTAGGSRGGGGDDGGGDGEPLQPPVPAQHTAL
jgi:hypothetical protein